MSAAQSVPSRFIGLDVHKHYLIAIAVDAESQPVGSPWRVPLDQLERWAGQHLTGQDAVVLEMTTNAFQLYDDLVSQVHSVTLVHPPHVALITRAQVKTDSKAALALAQLHAAGLLPAVWVPSAAGRDHRALVAQRTKFVRLATQAQNRLHAVLHRHHFALPEGAPFAPEQREWWLAQPVSALERVRVQTDWDSLVFAHAQIHRLEQALIDLAATDDRVPILIQLPGFGLIVATTVLAAIGEIARFPDASHLVGYAGLGTRVHFSGQLRHSGKITKAGRRDLRAVLVEAAQSAANTHPHWQAELARLEPRLGRNKAIVAIARKLLVAVWHVLSTGQADRFAEPERVARKLLTHAERLGQARRSANQTAGAYVRTQLDRLGLRAELTHIQRGPNRRVPMPPAPVDDHAVQV